MLDSTVLRAARWLPVATVLLTCAALLGQTTPADFSVVLLPDTQYYSESHPTIFTSQTQWIVNNRAAWNIQFVIGEGDIVNTPGNNYEWVNADTSIKVLDNAGIPYALAIGNHDYDGVKPASRGTVAYNQWFGVSRYSGKSWYLGHLGTTNENFATTFTVNGQQYLVLALEYYPRDTALSWAESMMQAYPDAKVLITTHSFTFTDGTRGDTCDTNDMKGTNGRNAQTVWNEVLRKQPNLQLVVSGHLVTTNSAHRSDLGDNGNLVNQIFTNYQNWTNGGNGYLRILKFRPSLNLIEVYTYSPYLNQYLTDATNQYTLQITNDGNTATTGGIQGKVRTPGCTAVANAQVTTGGVTVNTDSSGRFSIPNLAAGSYDVSESASGYTPLSSSDSVNNGYSTQMDFYPVAQSTTACTLNTTDPSVTICTPAANSTVTSPVHINAGTTASAGVKYMQIYVDGVKQQTLYASSLDVNLAMATGTHKLTVQAALNSGTTVKNSISITVGSGGGGVGGSGGTSGVTMTSPVDGSSYTSPVPIQATASSSVAISFMQLYVDSVKQYQVSGSTMNTSWAMATGTHRVTVQAKDANGTYYKQTANISVASSGGGGGTSGVTMTSPVNGGTYTSPVQVSATASSSVAISSMQLLVDNVQTYQTSGSTLSTSASMSAGSHVVTVQAVDANNVTYKQSATITVSTSGGGTTSGVTMTSPVNGSTYSNPVPISATASSSVAISYTQVYIDGVKKYQVNGGTLNTSLTLATGTRRVTVQAKDANGTYYKQTVYITVQ